MTAGSSVAASLVSMTVKGGDRPVTKEFWIRRSASFEPVAQRVSFPSGEYDVIHAHEWLVTHTAVTLKEHLDLPLVATIHATEAGRHQGWLPEEMNRTIHGVEHWLSNASARVIACSGYMRDQVARLFDVPRRERRWQ